jgi:hypothetical protein
LFSSIRSPRGPTALPARARTARAALLTTAATIAALSLANPARADLAAVGPVDPATQVPAWFQDADRLKLGLCLDGTLFCPSTPAQFAAPDGEAFYWNAAADLGSTGPTASLTLAQEAVSPPSGPGAFVRIRVRIKGGAPNATYTATHPFGTLSVTTNASGTGTTVDRGCTLAPCPSFAGGISGAVGPFLRWDPTVSPAVPPGYICDPATPHRVTGSPTNTNSFSVTGPGLNDSTTDFLVAGKLAGPPVPVFHGPGAMDFAASAPGVPVVKPIPVTSFGVPDPAGASNLSIGAAGIAGPNAAQFAIVGNTCSGATFASGTGCAITVQFTPAAAGAESAVLGIPHNAPGGGTQIALSGSGAIPVVAGASARSQMRVAKLRTTHRMPRARVLRGGLRLTMLLPQGAEILKISVLKVRRNGRVDRRPVWLGFRVLPSRTGLYRLRLPPGRGCASALTQRACIALQSSAVSA